jgi:CRISPR system Cascade subunit CasC
VALFGRMLADLPEANQHAACQVAHAISTHRVEREFDYFTAVDDLGSADETGAGMIGQVEFNSATFYRYAALDAHKLLSNLQGDRDLALAGITAFTQAMVRAIPSGKQNSFAAHNPPQFVGVVLRHASPFNLANAFERPVWPDRQHSLTAQSVQALAAQERQLAVAYGDARDAWAALDLTGAWPQDLGAQQASLDSLSQWLAQQVGNRLSALATAGV